METTEVNKSLIGKRCECIFTGQMVEGIIEEVIVNDDSAEVKVRFDKPQHWGDQTFASTWSFANKCDEYGSLQYLQLIVPEVYQIEYNLQKDKTWIGQVFNTEAEMNAEIARLKDSGYHPRRVKREVNN